MEPLWNGRRRSSFFSKRHRVPNRNLASMLLGVASASVWAVFSPGRCGSLRSGLDARVVSGVYSICIYIYVYIHVYHVYIHIYIHIHVYMRIYI